MENNFDIMTVTEDKWVMLPTNSKTIILQNLVKKAFAENQSERKITERVIKNIFKWEENHE